MENERNLLELCRRLREELAAYVEGVSPLYPGSEAKIEELSGKIYQLVGALRAEGGERLLATAKHLEEQLSKVQEAVAGYMKDKAKEN